MSRDRREDEHLAGVEEVGVGRVHEARAVQLHEPTPVGVNGRRPTRCGDRLDGEAPEGVTTGDDHLLGRDRRWGRVGRLRRRARGRSARGRGGRRRASWSWWSVSWSSRWPSPAPRAPPSPRCRRDRSAPAGRPDRRSRPTRRHHGPAASATGGSRRRRPSGRCGGGSRHRRAGARWRRRSTRLRGRATSRSAVRAAAPAPTCSYQVSTSSHPRTGGLANGPRPAATRPAPASSAPAMTSHTDPRPDLIEPPRAPARPHLRPCAPPAWDTPPRRSR